MRFQINNGTLIPIDEAAHDLCDRDGEVWMKEVTPRSVAFHRAYFGFLGYVWAQMPAEFQMQVPKAHFYRWIKMQQGAWDVSFVWKGTVIPLIQSIGFDKMSERRFRSFVAEQMPVIYEAINEHCEMPDSVIEQIEAEWERWLSTLT